MFVVTLIQIYQRYISILKPRCCRFYPSCSEYALWQFRKRNFFVAFVLSAWRILRCNPYNSGGFDYPLVKKKHINTLKMANSKQKIRFFYVPCSKDTFYYIKAF